MNKIISLVGVIILSLAFAVSSIAATPDCSELMSHGSNEPSNHPEFSVIEIPEQKARPPFLGYLWEIEPPKVILDRVTERYGAYINQVDDIDGGFFLKTWLKRKVLNWYLLIDATKDVLFELDRYSHWRGPLSVQREDLSASRHTEAGKHESLNIVYSSKKMRFFRKLNGEICALVPLRSGYLSPANYPGVPVAKALVEFNVDKNGNYTFSRIISSKAWVQGPMF